VPAGSVVVSGNLPSKDGSYSLYCAVIVKQVDAKTRYGISTNAGKTFRFYNQDGHNIGECIWLLNKQNSSLICQ
jgi:hypothetical protein